MNLAVVYLWFLCGVVGILLEWMELQHLANERWEFVKSMCQKAPGFCFAVFLLMALFAGPLIPLSNLYYKIRFHLCAHKK